MDETPSAQHGAGWLSPEASRERRYRMVEYGALFFALPGLVAVGTMPLPLWGALGSAALICLTLLLTDGTFDRGQLWNARAAREGAWATGGLFVVGAVVMSLLVRGLAPEQWLRLPRERPGLWLLICLLYPVLSVYPQNVIYRAFVFHRYAGVFTSASSRVWASAAAFAWGHVIFRNWTALLLTFAGGLIFAHTYERRRSVLLCSIEHALYGLLIFTIGLGGSIRLPR